MTITRRRLFAIGAAASSLVAAPVVFAQQRSTVRYATLNTGVSVIVDSFLSAKRLDEKNGLKLEVANRYTSVASYYSDFISGSFDVGIGAWDTYKSMHDRGVPLKFVSSFLTGDMIGIIAAQPDIASSSKLTGKSMAAVVATGAFTMCRAVLRNAGGVNLERDMTVQNVPNPAQAVTLLMAENVDTALVWEPNIASAIAKMPGIRVIYNVGHEYEARQGKPLPYFGLATRNEALQRDPSLAKRLEATFRDVADGINANPQEAFEMAGPKLALRPSDLLSAHQSGRLRFLTQSMLTDDGRAALQSANEYISGSKERINENLFPA